MWHADLIIPNIYEIFTIFSKSFCKLFKCFTSFVQQNTVRYMPLLVPFPYEETEAQKLSNLSKMTAGKWQAQDWNLWLQNQCP